MYVYIYIYIYAYMIYIYIYIYIYYYYYHYDYYIEAGFPPAAAEHGYRCRSHHPCHARDTLRRPPCQTPDAPPDRPVDLNRILSSDGADPVKQTDSKLRACLAQMGSVPSEKHPDKHYERDPDPETISFRKQTNRCETHGPQ